MHSIQKHRQKWHEKRSQKEKHMISEETLYEGRVLKITWNASQTPPPRALTTQASGLCFTNDGLILLVAGEEGAWSLPGGHPEPGETIEQALVREVWEEACALVEHLAYLGAQQVDDPSAPSGLTRYYQTRFWARVHLEPFHSQFETLRRTLATPKDFLSLLSWGQTKIAQSLFNIATEQ
jgi:ADP-ribose pyrophosphatase YjhB (NUDIX family)